MMELVVDLGVLMLVLTLLVGLLAIWRIGQVVSWPALAKTALATRSFAECVAFIRFCAEARDLVAENRAGAGQERRPRARAGHLIGVWPRVS